MARFAVLGIFVALALVAGAGMLETAEAITMMFAKEDCRVGGGGLTCLEAGRDVNFAHAENQQVQ